jgi:hypothetical protein
VNVCRRLVMALGPQLGVQVRHDDRENRPEHQIALAEPMPIWPRLKVKEYMNMAGKSDE